MCMPCMSGAVREAVHAEPVEEDSTGRETESFFKGMKLVRSESGVVLAKPFVDVRKQILPVFGSSPVTTYFSKSSP